MNQELNQNLNHKINGVANEFIPKVKAMGSFAENEIEESMKSSEKVNKFASRTFNLIKENPVIAVAMALTAGLMISRLVSPGKQHSPRSENKPQH